MVGVPDDTDVDRPPPLPVPVSGVETEGPAVVDDREGTTAED